MKASGVEGRTGELSLAVPVHSFRDGLSLFVTYGCGGEVRSRSSRAGWDLGDGWKLEKACEISVLPENR
jgi:hypothetical protein